MIRSKTGTLLAVMMLVGVIAALVPAASALARTRAAPSPRSGMGMAYDAARGQVALFGGCCGDAGLGDTWTWDGRRWTQRVPAHSPPPRAGLGMAYDAARGEVVLFGGCCAPA